VPISTFQVAGLDPDRRATAADEGLPSPSERFKGTIVRLRGSGARLADSRYRRSVRPARGGVLRSRRTAGFRARLLQRVTIDDRGLCYLIDRQRGVDIIETSVL